MLQPLIRGWFNQLSTRLLCLTFIHCSHLVINDTIIFLWCLNYKRCHRRKERHTIQIQHEQNQKILKHYLVCFLPLVPQVTRMQHWLATHNPKKERKDVLCTRVKKDTMWGLWHFLWKQRPLLCHFHLLVLSQTRSILGTHEINPRKQSWMSHSCIHWSFITTRMGVVVKLNFLF